MSLSAIRDAIEQTLNGVANIGRVHNYLRWNADWSKFLDAFKDTEGRIRGCMFARQSFGNRRDTIGENEGMHVFRFMFIMGLKDADATGIVFDDLLQDVVKDFEADLTLGGTCLTTHPDWGPLAGLVALQIDLIEPRMFGGVLCHYAEGRLEALEANY